MRNKIIFTRLTLITRIVKRLNFYHVVVPAYCPFHIVINIIDILK